MCPETNEPKTSLRCNFPIVPVKIWQINDGCRICTDIGKGAKKFKMVLKSMKSATGCVLLEFLDHTFVDKQVYKDLHDSRIFGSYGESSGSLEAKPRTVIIPK